MPTRLLSAAFAAVTAVLLVGLASALPAVLDTRPALLIAAALGASSLFATWRRSSSRTGQAVSATLAAGFAVIAVATAYDLTLAYRTEEVSFANGDAALRGTLYLPTGQGRHPAVVLVHGSGISPRKESRFYARAFARKGIAALAYDKRGSGESSGDLAAASYQALGDDAAQAVELLRLRPDIDAVQVGIRGVSEGEWTGVLAALKARAAFLIIVSGSGMTPAEQVAYETAERVRQGGHGEAAAQRAGELYRQLSAFQRSGDGRESLNRKLQSASTEPWFESAWYLEKSVPDYDKVLQLPWFPAWRARMDFDALPLMAQLTCPVLLQEGGADMKMDGAGAIDRMRAALARGGNTRFTGILYPRATHNVIEWRIPGRVPPPWFASGYMTDQLDWVARQVGVDRN